MALLLPLAAQPAYCQFNTRPSPVTGGATVTLTATLEQLSVRAVPADTAAPSGESRTIAIKTSWAVPANLTVLRMSSFIAEEHEGSGAGSSLAASRSTAGVAASGSNSLPPIPVASDVKPEERITLWEQTSGESNRAKTRIDRVNLTSFERRAPGNRGQDEQLFILIQAL